MRALTEDTPACVRMQFYPVCAALRPYLSAIYNIQAKLPAGETFEDWIYPEWTNFRFVRGELPQAVCAPNETLREVTRFSMSGPTCRSVHFVFGTINVWGVGLLPTGWARFVRADAKDYADIVVDGRASSVFAAFHHVHDALMNSNDAPDAEARLINVLLTQQLAFVPEEDPRVAQFHAALADPEVAGVSELAERVGMNVRSMERLSYRAFGFSPKILLRRQRFLRTLGEVMLDPTRRWTESLDFHYHDQAHFARDFKSFMGMSASDYMARPHPIIGAAVHGRMAMEGAPMQVLHRIDEDYGLR